MYLLHTHIVKKFVTFSLRFCHSSFPTGKIRPQIWAKRIKISPGKACGNGSPVRPVTGAGRGARRFFPLDKVPVRCYYGLTYRNAGKRKSCFWDLPQRVGVAGWKRSRQTGGTPAKREHRLGAAAEEARRAAPLYAGTRKRFPREGRALNPGGTADASGNFTENLTAAPGKLGAAFFLRPSPAERSPALW